MKRFNEEKFNKFYSQHYLICVVYNLRSSIHLAMIVTAIWQPTYNGLNTTKFNEGRPNPCIKLTS